MRRFFLCAAVGALLTACATPSGIHGGWGSPSLATLQAFCNQPVVDYGDDTQPIYSAFLDAYVAYRHERISKPDYCAFQTAIIEQHGTLATGSGEARKQWALFFNGERAKALSWRAAVDPTLRGG